MPSDWRSASAQPASASAIARMSASNFASRAFASSAFRSAVRDAIPICRRSTPGARWCGYAFMFFGLPSKRPTDAANETGRSPSCA